MNRLFTLLLLAGLAVPALAQNDPCAFWVSYSTEGLSIEAQLVSILPVLPPDETKWYVNQNANAIASGGQISYTFPAPGAYYLCATYPWANETCTVCEWVTVGICPCVDPSLINPDIQCPAIYEPVCGCDGVTYANPCVAVAEGGVTSWYFGPCWNEDCSSLFAYFDAYVSVNDTLSWQFQDLSLFGGGVILNWKWDFGDGEFSSEQNPSHTFSEPGFYTVCLSVTGATSNGEICESAYCQWIEVGGGCLEATCDFQIAYTLNGVQVLAWLESDVFPPQPLPEPISWTLDGGAYQFETTQFAYAFPEPGNHILCATYPGPDNTSCTVCKAIQVTAMCVDSNQINLSVPCPLVYDPVCGCDGITYGNSCEAYNYGGVTSWSPGPCGSVCNDLYIGFEGFNSGGSLTVWTFNSTSFFPDGLITSWYWSMSNGFNGPGESVTLNFNETGSYQVCLTVQAIGPNGESCHGTFCDTVVVSETLCIDPSLIDLTVNCPEVYDPVCGCDGVTYSNACVALNYHGVTSWTPGVCSTDCINPDFIDLSMGCPDVYDPICGCNGVTYSHYCDALYYEGVTAWTMGPCCQTPSECQALFAYTVLPEENTVILSDLSTNAESWSLDMGDGSVFYGYFDSLVYVYNAPGIYNICLEISNFAGTCTDTYCAAIELGPSFTGGPEATPFTLQLIPNPAQTATKAVLAGATPQRALLRNLYGQTVWEGKPASAAFDIPLVSLPAGMYVVEVETEKGIISKKLIVAE